MTITVYSQPKTIGDVLIAELSQITKDVASFKSGSAYTVGQVLGKVALGAASAAAKTGGNTGNGVFTLDVTTPILANARVGVYQVRCITAAANGGTFRVFDPEGRALGDVAVAGTFANHIKFVVADGAADFIVGDGFDVTIAKGSDIVAPLSLAALDGTQRAAAISLSALDSSASAQDGLVVARNGAVMLDGLDWPVGFTDPQKATAISELAALGIVVRTNS